MDISTELDSKGDCTSSSLSFDGKTLLLYKSDNKVGNIYISYFNNNHWTTIAKLRKIDSKYWEANACISPNGKTLYVASNRKGGYGGLDLYKSERMENGEWGPLVNLGPEINSPFHENFPQVINEGKTLYFSSQGHTTMGGFDIFYTEKTSNGKWTEPLNIGYPVNTTDDNIYYMPIEKGNEAYYARYPDFEAGKLEIYHYSILAGLPVSNVKITGKLILEDNLIHTDSSYAIVVMDSSLTNVIDTIYPKADNGEFAFDVPSGTFRLKFVADGYEPENKIITIHKNTNLNRIELKPSLTPTKVANGKYLVIRNIYFNFNSWQLTRDAKLELEKLLDILRQYPSLEIEFDGHTDSKGSSDYNLRLSAKRAKTVKNYLVKQGTKAARLHTKALGETQHIAINRKPDGSDAPEGRRLNRRVTIKVLNAGNDIRINKEIFIPAHLRLRGNVVYKVIVLISEEKLSPGYFENYPLPVLNQLHIKEFTDGYLYLTKDYSNYVEAAHQFGKILEVGFSNATLVTNQELENIIQEKSLTHKESVNEIPFYTIQIAASKILLDPAHFNNIPNLRITFGKNKYYRYTTGEYKGYSKAQKAMKQLKDDFGFKNAFIKDVKELNK